MDKKLFKKVVKLAHKQTKRYVLKYGVDYKAQYSIMFKFIYQAQKEAVKNIEEGNDLDGLNVRMKDIIKRGVKDTNWIDSFCESSLKDDIVVKRVCTDKMLYAISKYARVLEHHTGKFTTAEDYFYYNSKSGYALNTYKDRNKMYVRIVNVKKHLQNEYNNAINDLKTKPAYKIDILFKDVVQAHKRLIPVQIYNDSKIFGVVNFASNSTNKRLYNDYMDDTELINNLEDLLDKYNLD